MYSSSNSIPATHLVCHIRVRFQCLFSPLIETTLEQFQGIIFRFGSILPGTKRVGDCSFSQLGIEIISVGDTKPANLYGSESTVYLVSIVLWLHFPFLNSVWMWTFLCLRFWSGIIESGGLSSKCRLYLIILMVMRRLCWLWKIFVSLYVCSIFGALFFFLDKGGGRRGFEVFYFRSFWILELNALNASVLLNVGLGLYLETKDHIWWTVVARVQISVNLWLWNLFLPHNFSFETVKIYCFYVVYLPLNPNFPHDFSQTGYSFVDSLLYIKVVMSRRQASSTRRGGSFPFVGALNSKSKSSPLLSACLFLLVFFRSLSFCQHIF